MKIARLVNINQMKGSTPQIMMPPMIVKHANSGNILLVLLLAYLALLEDLVIFRDYQMPVLVLSAKLVRWLLLRERQKPLTVQIAHQVSNLSLVLRSVLLVLKESIQFHLNLHIVLIVVLVNIFLRLVVLLRLNVSIVFQEGTAILQV